jgi:glycosyltransferase involved in cell wall biosynthesis
MRILSLSTTDILGGAAKAAHRLHGGLRRAGLDASFMVQLKLGDDPSVLGPDSHAGSALGIMRREIEHYALNLYTGRDNVKPFDIQVLPNFITSDVKEHDPDLLHLHWICAGFIRIESMAKFRKPMVWTMHDMWPFTGGCHYSGDCSRFEDACGLCPQLESDKEKDASHWVHKRKRKNWPDLDLTLVSPSRWLAECAARSSLFAGRRIEVIPNGLDLEVYKPLDRATARDALGLERDRKYVMFSAMTGTSDERKGFDLLLEALRKITDSGGEDLVLLAPGAREQEDLHRIGLPARYPGRLYDDLSMAIYYNAADVFLAPSRQDNLPNTIAEALACGTPCAAFEVGGIPDMVDHRVNGYLARPFDTGDLARGILSLIQAPDPDALRLRAREKALGEFSLEVSASRYRALYSDLLSGRPTETSGDSGREEAMHIG